MELSILSKTEPIGREASRQTKTVRLTMESVVPDTRDDIGRILSVRPEIELKSKELRLRGAAVEGDAAALILYANEAGNAVSFLRLNQSFSAEFELPEADGSGRVLARFLSCAAEAKALNPRKLSVELEILCEMSLYADGEIPVSQSLPEELPATIHRRMEETDVCVETGGSEKTLSICEQLPLPETCTLPAEVIGQETAFVIHGREAVGSRMLVKGDAKLRLYLLPQGAPCPLMHEVTLPFSQLLDFGDKEAETAEVWAEPSSVYVETVESIDGQKLLNVELHALIQARGRRTLRLTYLSDAYSNAVPCTPETETLTLIGSVEERKIVLTLEERNALPEELEPIACYPSLGACSAGQGSLSVDLLCRNEAGDYTAIRRSFALTPLEPSDNAATLPFTLTEFSWEKQGSELLIRARAEGESLTAHSQEIRRVTALQLDEESCLNSAVFPTLTAVWADTESVWELAKRYHSSPEAIESMNADLTQRPLFIPKTE